MLQAKRWGSYYCERTDVESAGDWQCSPRSATKPRNSGFPGLQAHRYCFNDLYGLIIIVSMIYESESEVAQSCPTLRGPRDCSLRGSSVHGIFQARMPGASSRDPTHDKVMRRKPDRQGGSGFQGFWKAAPGAQLKDDIYHSDASFNRLLPNFCDTGRRPSLISFQIRINLEL